MNKQLIYQLLEKQMVSYADLKTVEVIDGGESLVALPTTGLGVMGRYEKNMSDMAEQYPQVVVRKTVVEKLAQVDVLLKKIDPQYQLLVTYGFRSLAVQKKYFAKYKKLLQPKYKNRAELLEAVHKLVAVPTVAGHPTGGAVDVTILKNGRKLNLGTPIYDFSSKDLYALSPFITKTLATNRLVLRLAMMTAGFAPFDGEWWHYSYGDKEWAFYYQQANAIYSQLNKPKI